MYTLNKATSRQATQAPAGKIAVYCISYCSGAMEYVSAETFEQFWAKRRATGARVFGIQKQIINAHDIAKKRVITQI